VVERRGILQGAQHAWTEGGIRLLAVRAARFGKEVLLRGAGTLEVAVAVRIVRQNRPQTLNGALEFVERFTFAGISIQPMQVRNELMQFLDLLLADPPATVLELGTGRGGTFFLLTQVAQPDAVLVSVDLPEGDASFGGRPAYKRRGRLYRSFGRAAQRVTYLAADSHDEQTRRDIVAALEGRELDLLFIDGDHSRAGVEADFCTYSPLVRHGGMIAFHDIVPGSPEAVGGVPDFWRTIRDGTATEIVDDEKQGGWGIGILRR
jgi:predicted O-methyltransferase YrrM